MRGWALLFRFLHSQVVREEVHAMLRERQFVYRSGELHFGGTPLLKVKPKIEFCSPTQRIPFAQRG